MGLTKRPIGIILYNRRLKVEIMDDVFFRPWIGENYKANGFNFNGKHIHILVLGESIPCGGCGDNECWFDKEDMEGKAEWEECRNKIINTVKDFLANPSGTYRRFTNIFMGHKCTPEETQMFWDSIVFYEYVQVALEKRGISPKQDQWETGEKPFFEILAEYNPDVIIAWGKRLWDNNMPPKFSFTDNSFLNRWDGGLRYYNNGKRDIPAYFCDHPCRPQNFSEKDTDYFKRLLEKVTGSPST
jgi:hypothetical protein